MHEIVKFRNSDIYLARINELKEFAEGLHPMKGSYLDDAVSYLLSNWDHLWTYLKDGSIPVTNVTAELSMKKIVQMRKNSLFFKNTETAKLNCYLMTIVQSAVKNHLDVYRYLNYCLHHITTSDVKALLPWNDNLYSLGENYDI